MFEVDVERVPARHYVSRTNHVRIEELEQFIVGTIRESSNARRARSI